MEITKIKVDKISLICWLVIIFLIGLFIGVAGIYTDIVSTKLIEPYKVVLTKVDGKVVKTYYYKQN
tara:strand:- start:28919 stop:29116 length:198 start_codon:yes stop_codon:yes gene_type:complete